MTFWDQPDAGAPADQGTGTRERPGGWLVLLVVLLLVRLVGGAYAATAAVNGDKVPRGTTISGVDVGGLSRADARAALQQAFQERGDRPVSVSVASSGGAARTGEVSPDRVGF